MNKIELKFKKFEKALISIGNIYLKPNLEDRSNIDATIQRFEFTFELFWKLLKEFFYQKGLDLHYPKDILKEPYNDQLIENESLWIQMLKDRNLTFLTYDEILADEIFFNIKSYVSIFRLSFDRLFPMLNETNSL